MDLQGNPIPAGYRGVKVTTDPKSEQPTTEPSGPVLNDSLAAESATHGGAFAENRGSQPMGVSSQNSTANTTDTSAATQLPPAADARDRQEPHGSQKYPDALGGQGNFPGPHVPQSGYVGGTTHDKQELGIGQNPYPAADKLEDSVGGAAPASGSGRQTRSTTAAQKNTSASAGQGSEFPDDPKYNASFNSEIGSAQDPGRFAEQKFQRREAETVAGAAGPAQGKGSGESKYSALDSDQRA